MKYLVCLLLMISTSLQATTITACGHPDYPPVSWIQEGELVGIAPTIATKIFAELGYQLVLDSKGNWERCLQEVKAGNIDFIVAAYKTESRSQYLNYTNVPLIADQISLFINRADKRDYLSLNDLKSKRVGLLLGDSFGDKFDRFLEKYSSIEYVSKGKQNFAKLAHQRIDFMPLGILSGLLQLQKLGYQQHVKRTSLSIATEQYYLTLSKKSSLDQHIPYINQRLTQLKADHSIDRLQRCVSQYYLDAKMAHNCYVFP